MSNKQFSMMAGLLVACLPLAACAPKASVAEESENHSVKVEAIEGSGLQLGTLIGEEVRRLHVLKAAVRSMLV